MSELEQRLREVIADRLELVHFNGEGCGTHGVNACSHCFGPSPMSAKEIAEDLAPVVKKELDTVVLIAEEAVRAEEREVITEIVDLVAPQYRRIPFEDLPEFTADAYRRGRNDMLDAIREILARHGIGYPPKDSPPREVS